MHPDPSTTVRGSIDMIALNAFLSSVGSAVGPEMILNPGEELYHYADLNGLLGIVEKSDLWLTHSRYSNDEEELAHGQRVAAEAIAAELQTGAVDAARHRYLELLRALIDQPSAEGVYICCFCRKDNLLSQWRGYGANGAGVSIQFDSAGFGNWTGPDCPHGLMRFWKVFYKAETQRKIMQRAVQFCWNPALGPEASAQRAADAIQFFIPTFKNADFEEEAEWRLIFTPKPLCTAALKFRARGSLLVPYYCLRDLALPGGEANPDPLPIRHITVGPSASKTLNVASVKMLLQRYGYSTVAVEASKTSFRG